MDPRAWAPEARAQPSGLVVAANRLWVFKQLRDLLSPSKPLTCNRVVECELLSTTRACTLMLKRQIDNFRTTIVRKCEC